MITIEDALKKLTFHKQEYFKWKFNVGFPSKRGKMTEEDLLKRVGRSTMKVFERWERTEEYKALVDIYLNSRTANDLMEVYDVVVDKAKKGDGKSIDLLIKLKKEIEENAIEANKNLDQAIENSKQTKSNDSSENNEEKEDDGLII